MNGMVTIDRGLTSERQRPVMWIDLKDSSGRNFPAHWTVESRSRFAADRAEASAISERIKGAAFRKLERLTLDTPGTSWGDHPEALQIYNAVVSEANRAYGDAVETAFEAAERAP